MALTIRPYAPEDGDAIVSLWHYSRKDAYPYNAFQQSLTLIEDSGYFYAVVLPENELWVAERDGLIVGFMAIKEDYIDQLFIAVEAQRTGVGEALLNKARELSPTRLRLATFQKNLPARAFYEKHGFTATAFGISPEPENEPDVHYEWRAS